MERNQCMFECRRCGYTWHPRYKVEPKVCPACKSPYWRTERRHGISKVFERGSALMSQYCPICAEEFDSYLNLARHMVLKDRPSGEHQQWLQDFLHREFPEYAFRHDKDIGNALRRFWTVHRSWEG